MQNKSRIELHAHSKLSLSYGITDIFSYINFVIEDGANAMALTDFNAVFSIPEFYDKTSSFSDFKPIFGVELLYEDDSKESLCGFVNEISVLALNKNGLTNINKILSEAIFLPKNTKITKKSTINKFKKDILLGYSFITKNSFMLCDDVLKEILFDFDYIEVLPPAYYNWDNAEKEIKRIIDIANDLGKIVVAVTNAHFIDGSYALETYKVLAFDGVDVGKNKHLFQLKSTNEMLEAFSFLSSDLAYKIVVENTNMIADKVEKFSPLPQRLLVPDDDELKDSKLAVSSIKEEIKSVVYKNLENIYGKNPHKVILTRLEDELDIIFKNGYEMIFYIAYHLTSKGQKDSHSVGNRGLITSSLVARLLGIVTVNPLPAHYICPECKYHTFVTGEKFGYNLKDKKCPVCGKKLLKEGHNLHYEALFGFEGSNKPVIDLNFPENYQNDIINYYRNTFGNKQALSLLNINTKNYDENDELLERYLDYNNDSLSEEAILWIADALDGVISKEVLIPFAVVYIPKRVDVFEISPVTEIEGRKVLAHQLYSVGKKLIKLNLLDHRSYELLDEMIEHAKKNSESFKFNSYKDIPLDDKEVFKLFNSVKQITTGKSLFCHKSATVGIPEFKTEYLRNLLDIVKVKNFEDLIRLSALSHGTNAWNDNGEKLYSGNTLFKKVPFKKLIATREDIFEYLLEKGMDRKISFEIMKFVRLGRTYSRKSKWEEYKELLKKYNVEDWFIWSCEQIRYLFPRGHAASYVELALRVAWFKLYEPKTFYSVLLKGKKELLKYDSDELISMLMNTDEDEELDFKYWLELVIESRIRGIFLNEEDL